MPRATVSAAHLLAIGGFTTGYATSLAAGELERWLVDCGFAERAGVLGLLRPTTLGVEVGGALTNPQLVVPPPTRVV
jgi:hypothetical protein